MNDVSFEEKVVLAVDDSPQLLTTLTNMLEGKCRIIAVTNASAAIKVLDKFTPSLFILDIEMPGMNGYALANIIRDRKIYKYVPIIFLTSKSSHEDVMTAMAFGGTDYIIKPVDKDALLSKVELYLLNSI